MAGFGTVIGGAFMNGTIAPATFGKDLVVSLGFKRRPLTIATVSSWQEIITDKKDGAFSAIGKAAAGAVLPGRLGKAATAAVGAALDSRGPDHRVRIDWIDGQQSLAKIPDSLFVHFALVLDSIRLATEPGESEHSARSDAAEPAGIADKAFDLVAGLVKDRWPGPSAQLAAEPNSETPSLGRSASSVHEQLLQLASLRDAGIITNAEFDAKKTELLSRL